MIVAYIDPKFGSILIIFRKKNSSLTAITKKTIDWTGP